MVMNVGVLDRTVRLVVGLLLIAYAIPIGFHQTGWNWVGWFGLVPLATAGFGVCPLYKMLRVTTR